MAHFRTTAESPRSPEQVFDLLADMRHADSWDPGVVGATLAEASPAPGDAGRPGRVGAGTEFDVVVRLAGRHQTLRYRVTEYERPSLVVLTAENALICSVDRITVEGAPGGGCRATYDADLAAKGLLRLAGPLLDRAFERIGSRAADGLSRVLAA